jgi:hypothetical protein
MATASAKYASSTGSSFTCTLGSLANNSAREATEISNTTNLYLDVTISGQIKTGAAAANGNCYILIAGYDGNNYPWAGSAVLTGADANVTVIGLTLAALGGLQFGQLVPGTGLLFGATVPTAGVAASTVVPFQSFNISQAYQMGGLALPVSYGVVVVNCQGQSLPASSAGTIYYNGINQTIA